MPKFQIIFFTIVATILLLWFVSAVVSRIFVRRSIRRMLQSVGQTPLPSFSSDLVRNLPVAVQRYLHYALKDGQPNIRYAILKQRATFRHRPDSPWMTVKATEYLSGMEPGFVWDAVLRHNAAWWRTAKLSYVNGEGHGHIKLFGAITLQEFDGPETDRSMLFRALSEQVWLPTGLLPVRTLRWEHVDDMTARAIIADGKHRVEALFTINGIGEIDRISTRHKYRDHKSGFEQQDFTMLCREWHEVEGVMIPTEVRFVWNTPKGDFEYGIFTVTHAEYYYK
ncbi:MAG TPA: hypothetical protein DIS79_01400 [Bacteroidetes bacterium]|nr:hypothetical protein [Bacteroidota bacterium]HRK04960.1 hypothetical protein [Chlorobiota bacterium]